jgi:hypothetical protein
MRTTVISAVILIGALSSTAGAGTFPDSHDQVPTDWQGPVFRLSQQFPATDPSKATPAPTYPWQQIDFHTQPEAYIGAVYNYVLEGNREVDWVVQNNAVRPWYHAPWMHYGDKGREYVRGMTRERTTPAPAQPGKGELGPQQTTCFQNWAVGFVNAPAGYVFGQVWNDAYAPDPFKALFPEGTVAAKLLFTSATADQAPYMTGALEWDANIDVLVAGDNRCRSTGNRQVQKLQLLQMDLAIRDHRADPAGWVFATYAYDGSRPGATPFDRMAPVGVMWGNDPTLDQAAFTAGQRVKETWINTALQTPQHLGYLGRLNGPVDNPISACLSCHMTAEVPARSSLTPGKDTMRWFANQPAGNSFDQRATSTGTDFNLQISNGIQNFQVWKQSQGGFVAPAPQAGAPHMLTARPETAGEPETLILNGERVYRVDR